MFVRLSKYTTVLEKLDKEKELNLDLINRNKRLCEMFEEKCNVVSNQQRILGRLAADNEVLTSQVNNLTSAYAELRARELRRGMANNMGPKPNQVKGFTDDELKSLIQLIHPDKHGGKEANVRMLQIINNLRNSYSAYY